MCGRVYVSSLEYFDEAVKDPSSQTAVPVDIHQPPAFLHKILQLTEVQLLYDIIGAVQVKDATKVLQVLDASTSYTCLSLQSLSGVVSISCTIKPCFMRGKQF